MLRSFRRLAALSGAERRLLLRALVDLGKVDLTLRLRGFRRLIGAVRPFEGPTPSAIAADDVVRAVGYARWVASASRYHVLPAHCLHRSLVLHSWLRREGLPSELRIGVRKDGARLKAHAWVELAGQVINDPPVVATEFKALAGGLGQVRGFQWR